MTYAHCMHIEPEDERCRNCTLTSMNEPWYTSFVTLDVYANTDMKHLFIIFSYGFVMPSATVQFVTNCNTVGDEYAASA